MAKRKTTVGRLLSRLGWNVVIGGIIFTLLSGFLAGFDGTGVVASIVTLAVLVLVVPRILSMRPGQETILSLILGIPIGITVINLVESLVGVSLPVLDVSSVGLFSVAFSLVIASYYASDLVFVRFFRKR